MGDSLSGREKTLLDSVYEAICVMEDPYYTSDTERASEMYRVLLTATEKVKQPEYDDWRSWK